ncbi:MAG TPA: hypothetical protein ENG69_04645 [Candidatus Korarchaeota archaeon]|nr:hypothetical protein [Candidatus Korarchaeota archaeon]
MTQTLAEILNAHLAFKRVLRQILWKEDFDETDLKALLYYALAVIEGCSMHLGDDHALLAASAATSELVESSKSRKREDLTRVSRLVTQAVRSLIESLV